MVDLLLARLRAGDHPIAVRDLLAVLALPKTEKSRLNSLLYKTATAHTNPLGLPRQYRLVAHGGTPPQWSVIRTVDDPKIVDPRVRCAWAAYTVLAAHPGVTVPAAVLLRDQPSVYTLADVAASLYAHVLEEGAFVELDNDTLTFFPPPIAPDSVVVLNCDTIAGPQRDHAQCVVLGMAIIECITANPGKSVVLHAKNPGTHAVLRHVLKTNEYARALNVSLAPLPAPVVPQ